MTEPKQTLEQLMAETGWKDVPEEPKGQFIDRDQLLRDYDKDVAEYEARRAHRQAAE